MSLNFLDKSSSVTPLLVRLYDTQRLDGLASDKSADAKSELIAAISELLEMELSPRESELVADVMIGLLEQAELDMRQALANKLAALDNVPLRLVLQMASDEISVADSILRKSKILSDLDLIYIIKSQGTEYWQSIAQRESINDPVMNILVDTADIDTAIKLAENKTITLNEYAMSALSDLAQKSDDLAQPLLRREGVPDTVAQKLYQFVNAELKEYIKTEYGIEQGSVVDAVDEILLDFIDSAQPQHELSPNIAMLKDASRQKSKGLLTARLMLASLRRGQIMPFVAQFARFTGLDVASVLEILGQSSGQGLATACKACGIGKEDFISIYLLTNRIRNNGAMVELSDLNRATIYYEKMSEDIALDILSNSRENIE